MFWDTKSLIEKDSLNEEIWNDSPKVQRSINQLNTNSASSMKYGAQQAMIDGTEYCLPWVPDIVGRDYKSSDSIIIIGSAYAGFIDGYSPRNRTMKLERYQEADNPYVFLNYFLEDVVIGDQSYYSPIQTLISSFCDLKKIVLFDLCRASFVCRDDRMPPNRKDKSNDRVTRDAKAIYAQYVESQIVEDWTWRRITDCGAMCIVALGTIAEHGLLRLFNRKKISIKDYRNSERLALRDYNNGKWVAHYAGSVNKKLDYWIHNSGNWWQIEGTVNGQDRKWYLLPVYHPVRYSKHDPAYGKTIEVLKAIKDKLK